MVTSAAGCAKQEFGCIFEMHPILSFTQIRQRDKTMFRNLIYETQNGRAQIILNRPQKRNALSGELRDALWAADDDTSVHAVVTWR
jgi:1,4-dihydroxy-2-naphthoyl-CoA synthase